MALVGLCLWQLVLVPRLPPPRWVPDWGSEQLQWLGPTRGPFFCGQDLEASRLVVAGDSRVRAGIHAADLDRAGLGPTALLWGPGGLAYELSAGLEQLSPRRLVLGLSLLSVSKKQAPAAHLVLREPPPELRLDALDVDLAAWQRRWRGELTRRGLRSDQIELELPRLAHALGQRALARGTGPASIDHRLGAALDGWRQASVRTIAPSLWSSGWMPGANAEDGLAYYRTLLPRTSPEHRAANLETIRRHLSRLVSAGWEVVCVRLPVSAAMADLEDGLLPPAAFEQLCAGLGVPLLDLARAEYRTLDGVHLAPDEARRFSADLARQLERQLGW